MSYTDDNVKDSRFQQSRDVTLKLMDFELFWEFINVHLIYKFQEDPNKTEWVILMIDWLQFLKHTAFFLILIMCLGASLIHILVAILIWMEVGFL